MQKSRSSFVFLILLIIYIPFSELLNSVLHSHTALSDGAIFWLIHWYEPIILLLLTLNCRNILKLFPSPGTAGFWTLILLIFGVLNVVFSAHVKELGAEGFRFALIYAVVFLLASISNFSADYQRKAINIYLLSASLVAMLAVIERFLPINYWEAINITKPEFAFGYGYHRVVAVIQSTSIIGGPNQLGTYLVPAFFLFLLRAKESQKPSTIYFLLSTTIALAIVLTFSRSTIIGLFVGLIVYAAFAIKKRGYLLIAPAIVLSGWLVWQNAYNSGNRVMIDLFTHGASQESHARALTESLMEIGQRLYHPVSLVFGSGLGTAGPIALKYGGMISESWYLQLILEIGLVGLILWLIFVYKIIKDQVNIKGTTSSGLLYGLISVMTAALFLHTFADNPAMSITLFTLLGMGYNNAKCKNQNAK